VAAAISKTRQYLTGPVRHRTFETRIPVHTLTEAAFLLSTDDASLSQSEKQREKAMPVGLFRSDGGWVQVDYGTGTTIPVTRSKYEANGYKPDFDQLPSEAEYRAAEEKHDNSKGA
jgi:hypothetical protein